MVERGKHSELHSDLERLKKDAASLHQTLGTERERVITDLAKLEQQADQVETAIEQAKPASEIRPISDALARSEAALAEQLKSY